MRGFQVVLHKKIGAPHDFSVRGMGPPSFSVERSSETHPFEQYLESSATAVVLAALTEETNDNTHFPKFHRLVVSSSRGIRALDLMDAHPFLLERTQGRPPLNPVWVFSK